jgi:hypothetical protein
MTPDADPSPVDDGRNPAWPADSTALALWEAVIDYGPLNGPNVGRLRLALDTLAAADRLEAAIAAGDFGAARDELAAHREVRQARAVASAEVARLTGNASTPARKPARHGHRNYRER